MLPHFQKNNLHGRSKKIFVQFHLPIVSTTFEYIVMKWVDHILEDNIDGKQFGGGVGTSTTDALDSSLV